MDIETIVGVATGSPDGGVAVVRLSGPKAGEIARALGAELPPPRELRRRALTLDAELGAAEDALVVYMPGPRSFTGEDIVELHVHAGELNVRQVVEACLAAGARAAEAGEFSRRAFGNGVLTLDQAEGIAALIGARTQAGVDQARRLVAGELGDQVRALIDRLHRLRVEVEANLDFPEDVGEADVARWIEVARALMSDLDRWDQQFEAGRRAREKSRVVLVGAPNAGKSSLMNALLGRERALVADLPGTTRDYVDAELDLGRQVVLLVDTAGIRDEAGDVIEAAGIERAKQQLSGADLVLHLVDSRRERLDEDDEAIASAAQSAGIERWLLWSQADRLEREWVPELGRLLSCRNQEAIDRLRADLREWCGGDRPAPWVGLARHRDRVTLSLAALTDAFVVLSEGGELELVAFSLGVAETRLGEIDGRSNLGPIGAEVMDTIFSSFCIGK